jgi:polyribonucleotide 5'-hydroxyl-kinase
MHVRRTSRARDGSASSEPAHLLPPTAATPPRSPSLAQAHFAQRNLLVVRAPKSGGVVVRSRSAKHESEAESYRRYFYGIGGLLCPQSTVLPFSSIVLVSVETAPPPAADMLPIGAKVNRHAVRLVRLGESSWPTLLKSILAVSYAQSTDDDAILSANIAGVVYVTHVDVESARVTVLAPSPAALPGSVLMKGSLKWIEAR